MKCIVVSASLLLAGLVPAQSAIVNFYGISCGPPSPAGTPMMEVWGMPKLGGYVVVSERGVQPQKFQDCKHFGWEHLVIGLSRTKGWGGTLPTGIPPVLTGNYPCLLWASEDLIMPAMGLSSSVPLVVPQDTRLLGMRVYSQWLVYYRNDGPGCGQYFQRWMTSNCAELVVGY